MNKVRIILFATAISSLILCSVAIADTYSIRWEVVATGGTDSHYANGTHLTGSVVQTAVGVVTSPNYAVSQGFWQSFLACTRGDANDNSQIDISDAVYIINYVFLGGAAPNSPCGGDPDGNGYTNISDAVWIINLIF